MGTSNSQKVQLCNVSSIIFSLLSKQSFQVFISILISLFVKHDVGMCFSDHAMACVKYEQQ